MPDKKPIPEKESITGVVWSLADLIQFQEGAIVSRVLLSKEQGTVTLFALDAGQEISEHTTPYDAMVQVIDGELEIRISGKPSTVQGGQVLIMPAHDPHALRALEKTRMILIMIRSE